MRILIILPNWLGDALMATPAIEALAQSYQNAKFTFVGSFASIEALKYHPKCEAFYIDETKKSTKNRLVATYKFAKKLGSFDMAVSFRNQIFTSLLLRFTETVVCCTRGAWHSRFLLSHTPKISTQQHLVKQYVEIAMANTSPIHEISPLTLYIEAKKFDKPTLGINAGATYGSAKRWYPERFAEVAAAFSDRFEILIFGGPGEVEMAGDIQKRLEDLQVTNFTNIAGKTTIKELCENIGGCSLFITNDSGPMHVAAAYRVPSITIFGPTKHKETSQWMNPKSKIVRHEIECAPCMKRECPLGHHECMKSITASEVIEAVKELKV